MHSRSSNQPIDPKPYEIISLSTNTPQRQKPRGQDSYKPQTISGKIHLKLTAKTSTFIASGVVAMGSNLFNEGQNKNIPLIKASLTREDQLIIPGSSLKGCIRSVYEAITASCLCKTKARREDIPNGYGECKDKSSLCPACQVFGAMGWQGLISFQDALVQETKTSIGFMASLYSPRPERRAYFKNGKVAGRKVYYHAVKALDKGPVQGIPIQQVATDSTLTTTLGFMNLTKAQLGTLFTALGCHQDYPLALKIGGGKPVGMGTILVKIESLELWEKVGDRYLSYDCSNQVILTGNELKTFLDKTTQEATQLLQLPQLKELQQVLKYPTQRPAPKGMY